MIVISIAKQEWTIMAWKSKQVSYFLLAFRFDLVLV